MKELLLVGTGGFAGSVLRYLIGLSTSKVFVNGLPNGTLVVNLTGSLLIGFLAGYFLKNTNSSLGLLLITGFCGGFTTFSAFSLDIIRLYQAQLYGQLSIYFLSNVAGGVILCILGMLAANKLA